MIVLLLNTISESIGKAEVEIAISLGDSVSRLSCFYLNWTTPSPCSQGHDILLCFSPPANCLIRVNWLWILILMSGHLICIKGLIFLWRRVVIIVRHTKRLARYAVYELPWFYCNFVSEFTKQNTVKHSKIARNVQETPRTRTNTRCGSLEVRQLYFDAYDNFLAFGRVQYPREWLPNSSCFLICSTSS